VYIYEKTMIMLRGPHSIFLIFLCLLCLLPVESFCQSVRSGPVEAELTAEPRFIEPGRAFTVTLCLRMDQGWYIYGRNPADFGLPTTLEWDLPEGFTAEAPRWPVESSIETQGVVSHGYPGQLILPVRIRAPAGLHVGDTVTLRARAGWLACRVECMPGAAELTLSLPVRSASGAFRGIAGLLAAVGLAFLGGLILNLMPCVLPVISLKVLSLVRRAAERGKHGAHDGVLYAAGVLLSFWLLAAVLLLLRDGGRLLGWGFQLQNAGVVVAAAVLFFLIGLNLFGVYEIGSSLTRLAGKRAGLGSFLSGMLATVVATPCTAPFMGVAIGYALAHTAPEAFLVFTFLGLGMALPMLVLSAFPRLLGRLPKPGPWMQVLRQAMGFLMMAAVIWMLFVLAGLADAEAVILVLGALLIAGAGAWVWGHWGGLERPVAVRITAGLAALVLILGAAGVAMSRSGRAPATAPAASSVASSAEAIPDSFWEPWSPQRMERLLEEGAPVFIDFTARWCLSCQVNETVALNDAGVRKRFGELGIAALKADWTDRDEAIADALEGYGRASVPLYVYYPRGSREPRVLPELLTPGIVLKALEREE
jgi:thiol:disulfide interchange protein